MLELIEVAAAPAQRICVLLDSVRDPRLGLVNVTDSGALSEIVECASLPFTRQTFRRRSRAKPGKTDYKYGQAYLGGHRRPHLIILGNRP